MSDGLLREFEYDALYGRTPPLPAPMEELGYALDELETDLAGGLQWERTARGGHAREAALDRLREYIPEAESLGLKDTAELLEAMHVLLRRIHLDERPADAYSDHG